MKQYTLQFETFDSLAQWLEGLDVKEVSATLVQIFRGELEAESLAVEIVKICKKILSTEKLKTSFELFTQIQDHYMGNYKGTGLGLAITKKIVELHNGHIDVESGEGERTCFTVSLLK